MISLVGHCTPEGLSGFWPEAVASAWRPPGPRIGGFEGAFAEAREVGNGVAPLTGSVTTETVAEAAGPPRRVLVVVRQRGVRPMASIAGLCRNGEPLSSRKPRGAVGSQYRAKPVDVGADVAAWSFHPRKLPTTGDGRPLTTDRNDWPSRAQRLRQQAASVSAAQPYEAARAPAEECTGLGFNYRATDLQGTTDNVQLPRRPAVVERRRALANLDREMFDGVPGLCSVEAPPESESNFQLFWGEMGNPPLARRERLGEPVGENISARSGIVAAQLEPAFASRPNRFPLPATERVNAGTLLFPLRYELREDGVARVADAVGRAAKKTSAGTKRSKGGPR